MKNVLTIIKKELRSYFNHPIAYILMVVFLALIYFFYFRPVMLSGETTMRPLFTILPWILIFFVPAISMGLIAREREVGTVETLITQPITSWQIIIGKFVGAFLFVMSVLLITLTIPLTLAKFGDFDWGLILSQYIGGAFLVAGFVAIGIWASSITKNQVVAFISSIGVNFILVFIGFEMVTLALPYPLNIIFKKISILDHFYNMARGVIDLKDVIYFLCLIIIFLFLAYLAFLKIKDIKMKEYRKFSNLIVILVVIAFIVNLSGNFIKGRLDLTQNKIFTLSLATKNIITNLDQDITINFFVSKKLPTQISSQAQDVKDLLNDYATRSNGKIKLNIYYPDVDNKASELATKKGVPAIQFNVIAKDELQVKQGYLGLTVEKEVKTATNSSTGDEAKQVPVADNIEKIPFIDKTDNLEYKLTSFIWQLTETEHKKISWLTGHGEKELWQDFASVSKELNKQYNIEPLNLTNNEQEQAETTYKDIPADTSVLVIAGNNQKVTPAEFDKINNYLEHGGSALILAKQIMTNPQFMTATSTQSNINLMLNEWGLNVNKTLVYDLKSHEAVTLRNGVASYIIPYPLWIKALASQDNSILGNIKSIVLPWTSPIEVLQDKLKENTQVIKLFTTTDFAGEEQGSLNINPQNNFSQDNLGQKLLAVALENKINNQLSRLVVVGDADFADEQFLQNSPENFVFMLNAIEWLSQNETLASIRTKSLSRAPLMFKSEQEKNEVKYFNIIGVPLLVILAGAWILWRRKKITKRIFDEE